MTHPAFSHSQQQSSPGANAAAREESPGLQGSSVGEGVEPAVGVSQRGGGHRRHPTPHRSRRARPKEAAHAARLSSGPAPAGRPAGETHSLRRHDAGR